MSTKKTFNAKTAAAISKAGGWPPVKIHGERR